jgi:hypothetical protein
VRAARNLYQVLQIDPGAEPDVIEVVYRRLARKYHPDVSAMADAAQRMTEINAAYDVLRDPERRAHYDRELARARTAGEPEGRWAGEPEPPDETDWVVCHRHPGFGAVAACTDCGAGLCTYCARLFQPATCTNCLLRWAGHRRLRLTLPAVALLGLLLVGYVAWTWLLRDMLGLAPSSWLLLGLAYWTGSLFFGIRGARELTPESDALVSGFIGFLLGPFFAPVLVGRSLWEYRRLHRLEAIARTG